MREFDGDQSSERLQWRAAGDLLISDEMGLGARFGGVGKEARKVIELRLRWIWNPWSGARESAGDSELAHSPFMATREGEGEGSEA